MPSSILRVLNVLLLRPFTVVMVHVLRTKALVRSWQLSFLKGSRISALRRLTRTMLELPDLSLMATERSTSLRECYMNFHDCKQLEPFMRLYWYGMLSGQPNGLLEMR